MTQKRKDTGEYALIDQFLKSDTFPLENLRGLVLVPAHTNRVSQQVEDTDTKRYKVDRVSILKIGLARFGLKPDLKESLKSGLRDVAWWRRPAPSSSASPLRASPLSVDMSSGRERERKHVSLCLRLDTWHTLSAMSRPH